MTRLDEIIANALAGIPETDAAILAREVVRLREAQAVVVPDDTFTLDLDEFGKGLACITINSKNRGVGYELCGTMGDGHFSRRTFDITPYLAHCLNTIGVRAIPADRVLGEPRPLACAPEDRPILAFWECPAGLISDVVHFHNGDYVTLTELIESGDDEEHCFPTIPRDAQWIELPNFAVLRANQGGAAT